MPSSTRPPSCLTIFWDHKKKQLRMSASGALAVIIVAIAGVAMIAIIDFRHSVPAATARTSSDK
jgi:hypothetical protein